ncbi:hypothetical protein J5N97_010750 [Dioscorea zingiberensis]|uniref:Uncharacterized protein n=1 Tax=Dioscorea zingiberensis TaxID=325984 RepID=A0A9D5D1S0_9LILI|nr:hypothetical protein J5N97_010750 [Dioscorea zingiberensis]
MLTISRILAGEEEGRNIDTLLVTGCITIAGSFTIKRRRSSNQEAKVFLFLAYRRIKERLARSAIFEIK